MAEDIRLHRLFDWADRRGSALDRVQEIADVVCTYRQANARGWKRRFEQAGRTGADSAAVHDHPAIGAFKGGAVVGDLAVFVLPGAQVAEGIDLVIVVARAPVLQRDAVAESEVDVPGNPSV